MNVEVFSQWLNRQGVQVYHTESSYWYKAGPRTLQAFPYFWLIHPSEEELRKLIFSKGIFSLRYSTPLEEKEGKVSYHIDLRRPYTLDMLKSQSRNGVKRGQGCFQIEPIPFARLADEGWQIQQDTLERQGRSSCMKLESWRRICLAAEGLPGFEAWGAIVDGELGGALFTAQIDDVVCVPYALSRSQYLREHVNNVLFFRACTNILAREEIARIFFTVQSLDAPESVDEFKLRMNFNPTPVRQRVVLNPLLTPLSTGVGYALLDWLAKRYPCSNFLAKTVGMVGFKRLGRLPLNEQQWPQCVESYRDCPKHEPDPSSGNGRGTSIFTAHAQAGRDK